MSDEKKDAWTDSLDVAKRFPLVEYGLYSCAYRNPEGEWYIGSPIWLVWIVSKPCNALEDAQALTEWILKNLKTLRRHAAN